MGDPLSVVTSLHHGPDEECRNPVVSFSVIFVPGHDQEAMVLLRPLDVGIQVCLDARGHRPQSSLNFFHCAYRSVDLARRCLP